MDSTDVIFLSACELRRFYRRRELSPVEVVQSMLQRIEEVDASLGAFVTVCAERALDDALQAERMLVNAPDAAAMKPLLGVPVSIKDMVPTKGIRTTMGSLTRADWVPDFDPPVVERIAESGAVLLGKTNTSEYGWKGESGNRVVGPTRNPWKRDRTAGGSSGGAAAAVASGLGPLAHGADGAGSIRIPASFCGVVGLKPSFGLIPFYPSSGVPLFAHHGVLARTVSDAALFLDVLAGPDPRDPLSISGRPTDFSSVIDDLDIRGLRVGWSPALKDAPVEPEVADLVAAAVSVFTELGCTVEEAKPDFDDPYPILDVIWSVGHATRHRHDFEEVRDLLDPGLVPVIEAGLGRSGVDVGAAMVARGEYVERMRQFMASYDILLTPTLPIEAFAVGADQPGSVAGRTTEYLSWTPFTYPFNITGHPAVSVPCGRTAAGLPVGLQIIGQWRDDARVIKVAAAVEAARPWSLMPDALEAG
jgi:aspartyl-tRNA(Asn)/glutamyl-tRNA(Gln) amidotransferase subunit A